MRDHQFIPSRLHLTHTPLPDPDLALAVHAHDLVELGAWLIASKDAALMTVVLRRDERQAGAPVTLWNRRLMPDAELTAAIAAPRYPFRTVREAAERAADALLTALSPRWPSSNPPRRLGVVTDGTGLGFCPDDPCPLATGWLSRQVRDRARLTPLLPFSPDGAWATLTAPAI